MYTLNSLLRFWRWHPEIAIRYLPIVRKVKSQKSKVKSILEVGAGWLGISPYLGQEVIGLDEDFEAKKFPLLTQKKGSILNIPFRNDSFDNVICVDVLEHLSKETRQTAINELLRIAKNGIYLGVPCGKDSLSQDREIDKRYRLVFDHSFSFLQQHLKFGLPEEEEISEKLNKAAAKYKKIIDIKIDGNENLELRKFLMTGWMTKNLLVDFVFRKVFLLFIPFFSLFDKSPYYRKLFFVKINS